MRICEFIKPIAFAMHIKHGAMIYITVLRVNSMNGSRSSGKGVHMYICSYATLLSSLIARRWVTSDSMMVDLKSAYKIYRRCLSANEFLIRIE